MRSKSRLWLLVIALLATAMIAVGCGDDDDGGDSGGGTTAAQTDTGGEATTEETPPADTGGDATEDTGGGDASDPAIQQAIESCKANVEAQPTISDDLKAELSTLCEEFDSTDPQEIAEKTKEVCTKIVDETVPEGTPGRDQALEACDAAAPTP